MSYKCKFPNCHRPVYQDSTNNRTYDYCGRRHAHEHKIFLLQADEEEERGNRVSTNHSYQSQHEDEDEEESYSLHFAIEESLQMEKRKLEVMQDEEYSWKLWVREQERNQHKSSSYFEEEKRIERKRNCHQSVHPQDMESTQWICSICTLSNAQSDTLCMACETPRQESSTNNKSYRQQQQQQKNPSLQVQSTHQYYLDELEDYWNAMEEQEFIASAYWSCSTCNTKNSSACEYCKQCEEPKILKPQEEVLLWPCTKCTFDNSYADFICYMCGQQRPSSFASPRPPMNSTRSNGSLTCTPTYTCRPSECGIMGCCKVVAYYGFCSKVHFDLAMEKNILPPSERGIEVVLVGSTGDFTAHLLRSNHPKHTSVKKQFLDSWLKKEAGHPTVQRIFWIRMKPDLLEAFDLMKHQLERNNHPTYSSSNVKRLFHGTSQSSLCDFGTNPSKPPCIDSSCRVCSIIQTSFDLRHVKRGAGGMAWAHQTRQLRYGEGIYFSPVSSKSNDYNNDSKRTRPSKYGRERTWKCMFLCNVALGRQYETKKGFLNDDQCPPDGYDSVYGRAGNCSELNYDEACIYNVNQAIPSYLIVYSLPS